MRIYKYIHSCLLIEEGEDKILFDPGIFSFIEGKVHPEAFKDVTTIIITHQHPDHVDISALKDIVVRSGASVVTNAEGKKALEAEMMTPQMVIPVHDGYAKDFFLKQRYENYGKYFSPLGIKFQPMTLPGDVVDITMRS